MYSYASPLKCCNAKIRMTSTPVAIRDTRYATFICFSKRIMSNLSLLIEYNILVEAYIPELPADNTLVNITAFINEAAKANPAFLNTNVKGEVAYYHHRH